MVRRQRMALRSGRTRQDDRARASRRREKGQDWVLTYTPEKRDEDDREKVLVQLTPRALHELHIETKDLSVIRL